MANAATATYSGRSILWGRMKGLQTEPIDIGWGTGGGFTGSANSDVNLFAPATETRAAGTSTVITTTQLGDTYEVTGSLTCLVTAKAITEMGLFDTTSLSPTTTSAVTITSNATTSLSLATSIGPATGNFYIQVGNEVMLVTGGQNTALITVSRGALGSTAASTIAVGTPVTVGGDGGAHTNFTLGGQTATVNAAQGGNNFIHADFPALSLSVNDSILFTVKDQLT
jgi:hypothetical protein